MNQYSDETLRPRQTKRTSVSLARVGRGGLILAAVLQFTFLRNPRSSATIFPVVPSVPFLVLACPA
jgi:hypothetical protein